MYVRQQAVLLFWVTGSNAVQKTRVVETIFQAGGRCGECPGNDLTKL
jgi:hypothetical protein